MTVPAYERASPARPAPAFALALGLLVSACATASAPEPTPAPAPVPAAWAAAIVPGDADRLSRLDDAWSAALASARGNGYGPELAQLGALANPEAALDDPSPPPGRYRCRTIKVGSPGGTLPYVAYGWFECEIARAGGVLELRKLTGSQRQHGTLYPDGGRRLVFLGTLALGANEPTAPAYGADEERNVVGVMERFAPARWRLVQPWPRFESLLDLLELQPL